MERRSLIPLPVRKYIPHVPHAKQADFLRVNATEAFYGGAAGGGKSDALLMAALQYVHVPGYSALIIRRDFPRLAMAGAIMDRAVEWLSAFRDVEWNKQEKAFRFPSGATIQFGYIDSPEDRYRYASSEFQFIGFDELTEMRLVAEEANPYLFLFSRLRKTTDLDIPLRVRSASNPGNVGHSWVKSRFVDPPDPSRPFISARIHDNPSLEEAEYRKSLSNLPPITRERLMAGDWNIHEDALIKPEWLRYYRENGQIILLLKADRSILVARDQRNMKRFMTVDPAGTAADRAKEKRGKAASWSVCQVWDAFDDFLILRHCWRNRVGFNELCGVIQELVKTWHIKRTYIENEKFGIAAMDVLKSKGVPIETISTRGQDKVTRATELLHRLEEGNVFLPEHENSWRPQLEAEWLSWQGIEGQECDTIDAAAYAPRISFRRVTTGGWAPIR